MNREKREEARKCTAIGGLGARRGFWFLNAEDAEDAEKYRSAVKPEFLCALCGLCV
jgi:hypothetical protein